LGEEPCEEKLFVLDISENVMASVLMSSWSEEKKHKLHFNMFQPPLCLLEPQAAVKAEAVKMHTR